MPNNTIKVLIYLPFYSGTCESRHARMHDLIQHMDDSFKQLPFEFKVIAERGKQTNSKNILYAKFPFLKKYTETYIRPIAPNTKPKKSSPHQESSSPNQESSSPHQESSSPNQESSSPNQESSSPNQESSSPKPESTKSLRYKDEVPNKLINKCKTEQSHIEKTIRAESNSSYTIVSGNTEKTENLLLSTLKILIRLVRKSIRFMIRLVRKSIRFMIRLVRKSIRSIKVIFRAFRKTLKLGLQFFTFLGQFRSGTAHGTVWKWCKNNAVANIDKVGPVDIFHIVRPNVTSDRMTEKLVKLNPHTKIIVGPNLMAYGHPSNGFDFDDFANKNISRVIAISSYHSKLLNEFGFSEELISRLPPSVNPTYFSPTFEKKRNSPFTIIFVASQFSVEKGALDFLNTIDKLENDGKLEFKAIMIGGFEVNKTVQTPVEGARWEKASKFITFAGKIARGDMQEYYRDADVFIHTGEPENGPTTVIEALSCGTQCILPNHMCFKEPELTSGTHYFEKGNLDQIINHIYSISRTKDQKRATFLPSVTHEDTVKYISQIYHTAHNETG